MNLFKKPTFYRSMLRIPWSKHVINENDLGIRETKWRLIFNIRTPKKKMLGQISRKMASRI